MSVSNNIGHSSRQRGAVPGRNIHPPQPDAPSRKRRGGVLGILSVVLLIMLIFAAVRLAAVASASNEQLLVRIGNQQLVTLDLRQSLPINPDLLGANVFPQFGTSSQDNVNGFMHYSPALTAGLVNAHIKLLRFPGGKWGEDHLLSNDQLSAFSTLLEQTDTNGMLQARLSGPIKGNLGELTSVTSRAALAGRWVDFLNNPRSDQRIGRFAHAPYHPVKYWTVGDEPDTLINPATGRIYTVAEYVNDFIQFSTIMHRTDPTIKVFGPEISEFYGPGAGPTDANGQLWMEGFLKGIGAYERAHNVILLDGVSLHHYQFTDVTRESYMFLSSTGAWNYLLPALHQLISQDLKHDEPIAITEINTNRAHQQAPARGLAALWWGDTLATLMNAQVEYVAFSSASGVDTPYPLFAPDSQQPTPMLRVMELFSHLVGAGLAPALIPLEVQRDPISVYATQDSAHQAVSLLFINKASSSQLVQISAGNTIFSASPWNSLNVHLMGYTMVVVTLHRSGNAEAYSFTAPSGDTSTTAPVIHTMCGNQTSTLPDVL